MNRLKSGGAVRKARLPKHPPTAQWLARDAIRRLKHRAAQRCYQQSSRGRATQCRYQQSAKGLETQRRYQQSAKGIETQRRYHQSAKGLETQRRYWQSAKGLETQRRYGHTPGRVAYKREWTRRYRQTALYKERQLDRHYQRADALFRELRSSYYPAYAERLAQYHRLQDFLSKREQEQIARDNELERLRRGLANHQDQNSSVIRRIVFRTN